MPKEESKDRVAEKKIRNLFYVFLLSLVSFPFLYLGSTVDVGGSFLIYSGLAVLAVAMLISIWTKS